ncbi:MAG: dihydropteroate synthase [Blastocatellia bacterium]|nr:dihydropteroate synthase [Blastocatellia bacterium]
MEERFSMRKMYSLQLPDRSLELGQKTFVMGVLNVTPDSFSDGGKFLSVDRAVEHALKMVSEGADIIDIGGESTRPGAEPVSAKEESERIIPVIESIKRKVSITISVDTYKSEVAARAVKAGAEIINDISGFKFDPEMAQVAAKTEAAVCLMHTRARPKVMQQLPPSNDIWTDIETYLKDSLNTAKAAGVRNESILLDPGIGFGKTLEDNLKILAQLKRFNSFNLPILIGTSRKSFIGKIVESDNRLMGTAATVAVAAIFGAHIVRVHDVAEMVEVVKVVDSIAQFSY